MGRGAHPWAGGRRPPGRRRARAALALPGLSEADPAARRAGLALASWLYEHADVVEDMAPRPAGAELARRAAAEGWEISPAAVLAALRCGRYRDAGLRGRDGRLLAPATLAAVNHRFAR